MAKKDELKAPDAFLKASMGIWDQVAANSKQIGIGLAVVAAGAIAFAAVDAHQANARTAAGADLGKALKVAARPVAGEEEEKPETPPPADEAPFKTDAEKQAAIASAMKEVIAKHPGTDAAHSALLPLGDAQLKLGQLDDAQRSYTEFVSGAGDDTAMRSLAELGLAKVAEAKKDYAAAATAYETLQRDAPHSFLKDRAALGKARMLELQGKKQDAANAYADVKDGFANSDASREAGDRLAMLATEGVKPPPRAVAATPDGGVPFNPIPSKAE
ncbi:MAG: tetratricopeptide repeat protein [Deltaproteobacteria bacterium]|nr:tetratricopeptide repeat protein [Deltaproteobacteria bacterium]